MKHVFIVALVSLVLTPATARADVFSFDAPVGITTQDSSGLIKGDKTVRIRVNVDGQGTRVTSRRRVQGTVCAVTFGRPHVRVTVGVCHGRRNRSDPLRATVRNKTDKTIKVQVNYEVR